MSLAEHIWKRLTSTARTRPCCSREPAISHQEPTDRSNHKSMKSTIKRILLGAIVSATALSGATICKAGDIYVDNLLVWTNATVYGEIQGAPAWIGHFKPTGYVGIYSSN